MTPSSSVALQAGNQLPATGKDDTGNLIYLALVFIILGAFIVTATRIRKDAP